jgi:hypothetical protein
MLNETINPVALAQAFGVWAAVVGMIGIAIVWELSRLRREVRELLNRLNSHMVVMEHRVTAVETHLQYRDGFTPRRVSDHGAAQGN